MQRHVNANTRRERMRPHAAGNDDILRRDIAGRGAHTGHLATVIHDRGNFRVLEQLRATRARAFGQGIRDIDGVRIAIRRNVNAAEKIVSPDQGITIGNLVHADDVDLEIEDFRHRGTALQFVEAFLGCRDRYRAALAVAGGLPGLILESAVKLAGVFRELGHVDRCSQLADQPGGVPGGAARELLPLQQYDVFEARVCQVIGNRTADHAATDDGDFAFFWQVGHQALSLSLAGSYAGSARIVALQRCSSRPTVNPVPGAASSGDTYPNPRLLPAV